MRITLAVAATLALSGCASRGPHIEAAADDLPDPWPAGMIAPAGPPFWSRFGDDALGRVARRALAANPTLAAAEARVGQARGPARIAGAALLPTIGASAGVTATRTDNTNTARFAYNVGQAGLDIGYDVDLFGGNRAARRAARARADAAAWDRDAAALVVETDAARLLVQWAALGARAQLLERDTTRAAELARVLGVRLHEGEATRVELSRQSIEQQRLAAQALAVDEQRERLAAALAALLGLEANIFRPEPLSLTALAPPAMDPGQPGDLLFRRPDIRAAEARIAAARGDVAAARAAFRPSLRLTGSGLVQAAAIGGPFGITLSAGASLLAPIFQGGRLKGQYEVASATQVEAVALYREALLRALAEGEQALAGVRGAAARERTTVTAAQQAAAASRTARVQYLKGEIPLDVLIDIERTQTQVNDDAITARQDRLLAAIDLYKALGGPPNG